MKTLVIALLISMLPSFLTMSYAGDSGGEDSPVLPTGTNSLATAEQWRQFTQLVDDDDYENLEAFLKNLENKELFLKSQYTDENEEVTCTPLHYASLKSVPAVVGLLIEQGANVHATVQGQATALHYAAKKGNSATVQFLLSKDDSLASKPDEQGFNPLHVATLFDLQDIVQCFRNHMLKNTKQNTLALKAQDNFGNTPVHYAFSSGNEATATKIVTVLTTLDPGDIKHIMQMKNKDGKTPQEIIQEIIQNQPSFSALQEKINQKILKG